MVARQQKVTFSDDRDHPGVVRPKKQKQVRRPRTPNKDKEDESRSEGEDASAPSDRAWCDRDQERYECGGFSRYSGHNESAKRKNNAIHYHNQPPMPNADAQTIGSCGVGLFDDDWSDMELETAACTPGSGEQWAPEGLSKIPREPERQYRRIDEYDSFSEGEDSQELSFQSTEYPSSVVTRSVKQSTEGRTGACSVITRPGPRAVLYPNKSKQVPQKEKENLSGFNTSHSEIQAPKSKRKCAKAPREYAFQPLRRSEIECLRRKDFKGDRYETPSRKERQEGRSTGTIPEDEVPWIPNSVAESPECEGSQTSVESVKRDTPGTVTSSEGQQTAYNQQFWQYGLMQGLALSNAMQYQQLAMVSQMGLPLGAMSAPSSSTFYPVPGNTSDPWRSGFQQNQTGGMENSEWQSCAGSSFQGFSVCSSSSRPSKTVLKNVNKKSKDKGKGLGKGGEHVSNDLSWNSKDYEDALNLWTELENPQQGVRFDPTSEMSSAAIELAKLGRRTLSLLPLREGNMRKAKKSVRSYKRMAEKKNTELEGEKSLEEALLFYQTELSKIRAQRP